ncbi:diguanylate cyclase (GGDEF) domain-containing protein [Desulfurobacterium pacificum]|uniref:diguanylate cyclase n=1 Tax=Desulfurobacterium pacificum TaxID=240166 RepID=A0ABY1NHB0_9BACT|nr:diguanylate cyclase [Desulfurobacterium pacificum]SMP07794.1 diguanylate cyclase (GGDEF) domain-containing protein [Desulfurobacterium pacificum]
MAAKGLDLTKPIEIAEDIFWVGYVVPNDPFQCHVYLIRNGDESILIDPGSMITFPIVLEKICEVTKLRNIKYIIMHHQDPDIVGCYNTLESIMPKRDDRRVVTHWRAYMLLKHYQWKTPFYLVDKEGWKLKAGDRELEFIFTPYAHFPGAFCTFDKKTKTLFSSDIMGAISDKFMFYAEDTEEYYEGLKLFHKHYMPSSVILNFALRQIKEKDPVLIAPQHGSIIKKDMIPKVMKILSDLECGLYLLDEKETDLFILGKTDKVLKQFFEDAILSSSFDKLLVNLLNHIKEEVPHVKEILVAGRTPVCKDGVAVIWVKDGKVLKEVGEEFPSKDECDFSIDLETNEGKIGFLCIKTERELSEKERKFLEVLFKKISVPLSISLSRELTYEFLERENKQLFEKATKDPLTGLYNRRYLFEYLKAKLEERKQFKFPLSLVMIDIDHFKKINDTYGHLIGDCILKEIALILRKSVRVSDCVARYGGEEFVIVMPFARLSGACKKMEKIRKEIENHSFCKDIGIKVTISAGVTEYKDGMSIEEFIERADENLYEAKRSGRNRVICK